MSGQRLQSELPENACFFLDDERVGAHFDLMYYADRSTYQIHNEHRKEPRDFKSQAKQAREAGAIPYLFSSKMSIMRIRCSWKAKWTLGTENATLSGL